MRDGKYASEADQHTPESRLNPENVSEEDRKVRIVEIETVTGEEYIREVHLPETEGAIAEGDTRETYIKEIDYS